LTSKRKIPGVWGLAPIREIQPLVKFKNQPLNNQPTLISQFSSDQNNASSHSVKNLPVLICGGGFKHGSYLKFNESENVPLCNLYLNMLQRLGLEIDSFGTSTGTLSALQMVG